MKKFSLVASLLLIVAGGTCSAQELRCTQMFMNDSEDRICATPALMALDRQMGELGRRVAQRQDSFKSDQRRFRRALKTCVGDEACLTRSYQYRIRELEVYVDSLPPLTEEEMAKVASAGAKAQEKREAQADTRERIAERLAADQAAEHAVLPVMEEAPAESLMVPPLEEAPAEFLVAPPVEEVSAAPEPVAVAQVAPSATDASNGDPGWGSIALMGTLLIGVLAWFKSWLNRVVRRCPGCKKWFAGKVVDSERDSYTDYRTKTFEDVHKDRNYAVTGRTTRQRQVKVRVVDTTDYYRCMHCDCNWALTSTSRSS